MAELGLMDLLALMAVQGGHTAGHFAAAGERGVPISLRGAGEVWNWQRPGDLRGAVDIHGAGFEMQDEMARGMGRGGALASALIKGAQLAGVPGMLGGGMPRRGDVEHMRRSSGNPMMEEMVLLSLLSDLYNYGSGNDRFRVGLSTFGTGQPGLTFNWRW